MKYKIVCIILLISICFCSCVNNDIKNDNDNENKNDNDNVQKVEKIEYDNLEESYDNIVDENKGLIEKNSSIQSENKNLKDENQTLKTEKESLETENQSLRVENESLKNNMQNMSTNTETISNNANEKSIYLMDVCPPYDSSGSNYDATQFKMEGETHMNGFFIKGSSGYILINLNEKYSNLEFDLGHVDGASKFSWTLNIYLDGKLTTTIEKNPDDMVTHENIQLNYAKQLKFEYISGSSGHYTEYGLGEIKLQY